MPSASHATEEEQTAGRKSLAPLTQLLPYAARYWWMILIALFMLTAAAGATLGIPLAARRMIDTGFSSETRDQVAGAFGSLLWLMGGLAVFSAGRFFCVSWLGERVVADLRKTVFNHLTDLSPSFFDTAKTGEILSRLTTDTTVIQGVVGVNASIALRNAFMVFGGIVMMFLTNATWTLVFLITGPGVILPLMLFGRRVRRLARASQDRIADTSALAGESIQSMATVQAFVQEQAERSRFSRAVEAAFKTAERRIIVRAAMTAVAIFAASGAVVGALWLGAEQVMSGSQSAGNLVQFVFYAVLTSGSIGALGEVWGELQRASGSTERLMELLDLESDIQDPAQPLEIAANAALEIEFDGVSFAYPTRAEESTLSDISFKIQPGQTIALVGPSGAGKSTVLRLLMRFYDPVGGQVKLAGQAINQLTLRDLRSKISLVSQDPVVFSGTITENIAYGRSGANEDDIRAAARAANADGFISQLPNGYDTLLGERGITLSGGQRQRIALARAFLKDAPILLLDEPTSALDSASEAEVQEALASLQQGRTCLIIAHRLSTIRDADRILVFNEGGLVGDGTHQELVTRGGLYADLARLQVLDNHQPAQSVANREG